MKTCRSGKHTYDNSKYKQCLECKLLSNKKWQGSNPEKYRAHISLWERTNKERVVSYRRDWDLKNSSQKQNTYKKWYLTNLGRLIANSKRRILSKTKATPPWLTKEQLKEMQEFYVLAKELQWLSDPTDPLEVDHIIPLQGENVCGLHVPWNLQILPRSLNRFKSNRF